MLETVPPSAKKVWTEAELQALPDDGYNCELVNGELVMSPKNNFEHENLCGRLFLELANFNRSHRLGAVLGLESGVLDEQSQLPRAGYFLHSQSAPPTPWLQAL